MIDLHCHVLPGVDDGPADWDAALDMMRMADRAGTTMLVATPHSHDFWRAEEAASLMIPRLVQEANQRARQAGLKVRVLPGQECQVKPELLVDLRAGDCLTLGDSRTVLMELPFTLWPPFTETVIFELQVAGYTVLLAHPERYRDVQKDPNLLVPLVERGVYMQVTTTSILGHFGDRVQETARLMVEHNLAHVLASDAHSTRTRTPTLDAARDVLIGWVGKEATHRLCVETPYALLLDEPPPLPAPERVEPKRKRFGFL